MSTTAFCVMRSINLSTRSLFDRCSGFSRSCHFKSLIELKCDHALQTLQASFHDKGFHIQASHLRDSSLMKNSSWRSKSHSSIEHAHVGSSESHVPEEGVGVLLLNLGGPETLQDVEPFLFNLFADPDIIRLPTWMRFLQRPLAKLISVVRAPKSKEGYASIGGGSPLRKSTDDQAHALKMALEAKKQPVNVYVGMRYWHPFTEEAIKKIKEDGIKTLVVLPLYPQFSISTTGSSIQALRHLFKSDASLCGMRISIIESWYHRSGYIRSMADVIETELGKFSNPREVMIFFSAHGVPLAYVKDAGDPYKDQIEECIKLIMKEMQVRGFDNDHTLAYQSRVGPVEWLKPYTDKVLVELGKKGVNGLIVVPISFVSEHIETLEEIDMEYKKLAIASGIQNWGRVPALSCTPSFIEDLADAVLEALPLARNPRCVFCIGPNPCFS